MYATYELRPKLFALISKFAQFCANGYYSPTFLLNTIPESPIFLCYSFAWCCAQHRQGKDNCKNLISSTEQTIN